MLSTKNLTKGLEPNHKNVTATEDIGDPVRELVLLKKETKFQQALRDTSGLLKAHNVSGKTIFISYTWEDERSEEGLLANTKLQAWLLRLSKDLETLGTKVLLDVSGIKGHMSEWMEGSIAESDHIILIGTNRYKIRASQETNVAFEYKLILQKLQQSNQDNILLPILYDGDFNSSFPGEVGQYLIHDFRQSEQYYQQLLGLIKPVGIVPNIYDVLEGGGQYNQEYMWLFELFATQIKLMEAELNNLKEVRNKVLPFIVDELPASSPFFVGRTTELAAITDNFCANKKILIVQGIGGSGKSQLAAEYAHNSKTSDKAYRLVRWLKADNKENLKDSYLRLGDDLGVKREEYKDSEINLKKAIDYQLSRYENILLIYDNVESLDYIESYLPNVGNFNADILLTTRNRFTDYLTIEIGEFSSVEVQSYLSKRLKRDLPLDISEQLGKELGYLPLAVVQSGAYMVKHAKTPEAFLKLLQGDGRQNIIEQGADNKLKAVANLWEVTLNKLSEQSLELLRLCAYLNPDNVPRALLEQMTSENLRDAVLFELRFQSLLVDTGNGEVFRIHRLLQEAVRKQFTNQDTTRDKLKILIEKAIEALKVVIGSHELAPDKELLLFWKQNAHLNIQINLLIATGEELKIREDLIANLYDWAGEYQEYINLSFTEGLKLHQQALAIKENIYKDNHPDIANSLYNISGLYAEQAKFAQALEYAQKALVMRKEIYGDKHAAVANCLDSLGYIIFIHQGKSGNFEAIKYFEEALDIRKIIYGNKHPEVATSLCNIGDAILPEVGYGAKNIDQKRYLEPCLKALKYFEAALVIRLEVYDNKHPDVASSLVNIGSVYGRQSVAHFKLAIKHYEEALKIKKSIYGNKHPEIAKIFLLIGQSYHHQAPFRIRRKALGYYKEAVAVLESVYGNNHPAVASALLDLSAGYCITAQYVMAYEYSKKALEIYEPLYDAQHPEVIKAKYEVHLKMLMVGFAPVVAPIIQPLAGASIRRTYKLNYLRADRELLPQQRSGLYFSNNAQMHASMVATTEINERKAQAPDGKERAKRSECVLM